MKEEVSGGRVVEQRLKQPSPVGLLFSWLFLAAGTRDAVDDGFNLWTASLDQALEKR